MDGVEGSRTVVLTDVNDERGRMWRAVRLEVDGGLTVLGHDLGRGVDEVFGMSEYEFVRRYSPAEASLLSAAMGLGADDDLLDAVAQRFHTSYELESFASSHGVAGVLWSRVGD